MWPVSNVSIQSEDASIYTVNVYTLPVKIRKQVIYSSSYVKIKFISTMTRIFFLRIFIFFYYVRKSNFFSILSLEFLEEES